MLQSVYNSANALLLFFVCLVGINTILSLNETTSYVQTSKTVEVVVLDSYVDSFNQLLSSVWYLDGIWQVKTPLQLKPGHTYRLEGKVERFDVRSESMSDTIRFSIGYDGEITTKKVEGVYGCDVVCKVIYNVYRMKVDMSNSLYTNICNPFSANIRVAEIRCNDIAAFSKGLLLGQSVGFSDQITKSFRNLGISHILVASGFQVVLIMTFFEQLLVRLRLTRSFRVAITLAGVFLFVIFAGPQPPIVRSGVSAIISILVLLVLGRKINSFRALIYSAMLMLLYNPAYISSISFQLSVLASFAIITTPSFMSFGVVNRSLLQGLWGSVASTLFTLPIISNIQGSLGVLFLVGNMVFVPLIPLITGLNIMIFVPFVGEFFGFIVRILQEIVLSLITDLGGVSHTLQFDSFSTSELIIYYGLLLSSLILTNPSIRTRFAIKKARKGL